KSKFFKTPYSTYLDKFDRNKGCFNAKYDNHLQANRILNDLQNKASKILDTMIEDNSPITIIEFEQRYNNNYRKSKESFISFFESQVNQLKKQGSISTSRSYAQTINS